MMLDEKYIENKKDIHPSESICRSVFVLYPWFMMRDANNTVNNVVFFLTDSVVYLWNCFKFSPSFRNLKKSSI